jgi:lipoate-protein ligase A
MPEPVRCLLHRAVLVVGHPGHACGEAGGRAVRPADRRPSVRFVRTDGAPGGLLVLSADAGALRIRQGSSVAAAGGNGTGHAMKVWRFLDSGPAPGARNMALDECLLAEAARGSVPPVLRFYGWAPPAVSLGRFQDEAEAVDPAACARHGIDIVRRITGGRAVLHDRELTYSIVAPVTAGLFPNDVLGTYKVIAGALLAGLRSLGVAAEMVSRPGRPREGQRKDGADAACFASPSWYEIVAHGRKIVGSAQRRVPGAFLQHGSILIEYDPELEAEIIPGGGAADAVTCLRRELGGDVPVTEIKKSILSGFRSALGISLAA